MTVVAEETALYDLATAPEGAAFLLDTEAKCAGLVVLGMQAAIYNVSRDDDDITPELLDETQEWVSAARYAAATTLVPSQMTAKPGWTVIEQPARTVKAETVTGEGTEGFLSAPMPPQETYQQLLSRVVREANIAGIARVCTASVAEVLLKGLDKVTQEGDSRIHRLRYEKGFMDRFEVELGATKILAATIATAIRDVMNWPDGDRTLEVAFPEIF